MKTLKLAAKQSKRLVLALTTGFSALLPFKVCMAGVPCQSCQTIGNNCLTTQNSCVNACDVNYGGSGNIGPSSGYYWSCLFSCGPCLTFGGPFIPYTQVATNILFFTNGVVSKAGAGNQFFFNLFSNGVAKPINLTVAAWNGSNVLATTTATNVEFFVTESTNMAAYTLSSNLTQLPWTDLGFASFDATNGFWHLQWTPPSIQRYVVQTRVYDPTLTNLFLDNAGVMTNGYTSLLNFISPGSTIPTLTTPVVAENGDVQVQLIGPAASSLTLQVSADLKTWSSLFTVPNFSGQTQITDASGAHGRMFYRALLGSDPFSQLQVLLPGETNAPYTTTGKIGTPNPIVDGQVTCTVLATDSHWVPVPGVSDTINVNCSDPYSISPTPTPLVNGSGQFTFSFTNTQIYRQDDIIAVDVSNGSITPAISSQFNP